MAVFISPKTTAHLLGCLLPLLLASAARAEEDLPAVVEEAWLEMEELELMNRPPSVGDFLEPQPQAAVHFGKRRTWERSSPFDAARRWMAIRNPNDSRRHVGRGSPLRGTSWRNRPYHLDWFVGGMFGDALIDGSVEQTEDLIGGYRIGHDFSHYFGYEGRFAFANLDLTGGGALPNPNTSRDWFWDVECLYYPWGDAKWRPYATLGLGLAGFRFTDGAGRRYDEKLAHLPVGFGVKYLTRNWLALRIDAVDNIAFGGSGLDTMHNWSVTGGVEIRFGGRRHSYFPWSPGVSHF